MSYTFNPLDIYDAGISEIFRAKPGEMKLLNGGLVTSITSADIGGTINFETATHSIHIRGGIFQFDVSADRITAAEIVAATLQVADELESIAYKFTGERLFWMYIDPNDSNHYWIGVVDERTDKPKAI